MKHSLIVICAVLSLFTGFESADKGATVVPGHPNSTSNQMRIKIGSSTFTATLYDNATATAFKGMLPMTVNMSELNGNEKYFDLSVKLPTNASNPGTIQSGELMIYGSNTLVLFYETLSTSYSYTRLGRINDTTGLAAVVGSGSVTVTMNWSKVVKKEARYRYVIPIFYSFEAILTRFTLLEFAKIEKCSATFVV